MRAIRKITAVDIREVTGYSRNQLRGLLDELPIYSEQETAPRIAREFSRSDLTVLAVVHVLETRNGVRRKTIAPVITQLRKTLTGPKTINRGARLLISFDPPTVSYLTTSVTSQDGILVSLGPIFDRVDQYLNFGPAHAGNVGPELNLGPTLVTSNRKKAAQG